MDDPSSSWDDCRLGIYPIKNLYFSGLPLKSLYLTVSTVIPVITLDMITSGFR
ncbi:hypothetical protein IMCC3135_16280 [Granulosicoccus antarcticus IMCC3135]|uniref:Uncharacterized protein n=1 Tax=Granulosicoccus antarcticus IMCC3135 TaxID=1192854 RepID=A0A2Z2NUD3_9GAMM|nr:hypothetical protein IMCC3135_16280 [Granulosicoccus antarcticus IMCC3135]